MSGIESIPFDKDIPTNANAALCLMDSLYDSMCKDPLISRTNLRLNLDSSAQNRLKSQNSASSLSNNVLLKVGARLVDDSSQFQTYLFDIHSHLNLLIYQKTKKGADTANIQSLMEDIDTIEQKITTLIMDLGNFYEKHRSALEKDNGSPEDSCWVKGHKSWLSYFANFLFTSIESVRRFYRIVTLT